MNDLEPAAPAGFPGSPPSREPADLVPARPGNCKQELEEANAENARLRKELAAKDTENAQLKEQVAELKRQLEARLPDPGPPAPPFRPYPPEGPFGKGPGGLGFGR
jgi:hypothetical protein